MGRIPLTDKQVRFPKFKKKNPNKQKKVEFFLPIVAKCFLIGHCLIVWVLSLILCLEATELKVIVFI